ncbi:YcaO-like family protein [Staphylococcus chromogenes]|uniref:YcaO-like family protein n=1 Tax=Staphylococcus chromogenes TaxID=46126 RepID=UPI002884BA9F|nr:YcaO-like family protein [Staphylococcus chromogenes]MDT0700355.1 YcaO-like family protein [Staphylococcus chromogenes]
MIYDNNSELFFNSSFIFHRSLYRNEPKYSSLYSTSRNIIIGESTSFNPRECIYSSIGEFVERVGIIKGHSKISQNVKAFSLLSGEVREFNKDDIYLTGKKHNDSCGLASHINSCNAIENALLEFIERQSFIDKCVFKRKGRQIDISNVDKKSSYLIKALYNHIDEVKLFEISILPEAPVILSMGTSKHLKCIGLACKLDINDAIYASLEESLQSFTNVKNKFNYKENVGSNLEEYMDLYSKHYSSLPVQDFKDYYSFLNSSRKADVDFYRNHLDINEIVKKIYEIYNVDIFCILIKNPLFLTNAKIVKVFSPNGYPHMYPKDNKMFKKSIYSNSNIEPDLNIIPFP